MSNATPLATARRRAFAGCLALAGLLLLPFGAARADPAAEAASFVRGFSERTQALLAVPPNTPQERVEHLRRLVLDGFDIEVISRFVLGRSLSGASESDLRDYRRAYEDYIVHSLAQRLANYGGETLAISEAHPTSSSDVLVASTLVRPTGVPVRIDWRLRPTAGGWRIVDLVVEGLSLIVTQRDEFASVLRAGGGIPALAATLRQRSASL